MPWAGESPLLFSPVPEEGYEVSVPAHSQQHHIPWALLLLLLLLLPLPLLLLGSSAL
jgi:hypothetical protein